MSPDGESSDIRVETPMFSAGILLGRRYRIDQPLASGGMSEVWRGHDTILRRDVALKLLHPHLATDHLVVERFRREAISAAGLGHPNIVPTFDTGEDETGAFIVMGLVQGPTLKEVIASRAPLTTGQITMIARQVADALAHAHGRGIIHRDIKPANILLVDSSRVLVTDFGIAKAVADAAEAALTMPGLVVATPGYSAPEQLRGEQTDARVDIYALGVLVHEMACRHPVGIVEEATVTLAASQTPNGAETCPELPDELRGLVVRATAHEPGDRYQSAAVLASELSELERRLVRHGPERSDDSSPGRSVVGDATEDRVIDNPTVTIPAKTTNRGVDLPTTSGSRRRRTVVGAVVVALVLVALGLGQFVRNTGDEAVDRPVVEPAISIAPLTATSFDPFGTNGEEHEAEAPRAVDNNAATAWTTETYVDRTMNKPGVGLIVRSTDAAAMNSLEVQSRSNGWSAQIFVADGAPATLEGWGEAVDTQSGLGNSARFDLKSRSGDSVLLWVTDVGNSGQFAATEIRIVSD